MALRSAFRGFGCLFRVRAEFVAHGTLLGMLLAHVTTLIAILVILFPNGLLVSAIKDRIRAIQLGQHAPKILSWPGVDSTLCTHVVAATKLRAFTKPLVQIVHSLS